MSTLKSFGRSVVLFSSLLFVVSCAQSPQTTQTAEPVKQTQQGNATDTRYEADSSTVDMKDYREGHGVDKTHSQCEILSRSACLRSDKCVLEQGRDKKYHCRAAKNHCETGFVQAEDKAKATCKTNGDCRFTPASCYCPADAQCICGGGPPAACTIKSPLSKDKDS